MKTAKINPNILSSKPDGYLFSKSVFNREIKGLFIKYLAIKGPYRLLEKSRKIYYDVLVSLKGNAILTIGNHVTEINPYYIIRIPYHENYSIHLKNNQEFYFFRFRKQLDEKDQKLIIQNPDKHSSLYLKSFSECPVYIDDIKSSKTVNRMILPEGFVPRFCMGSVQTQGPDSVGEHEHAMLEQLYFGLENCKCICYANGDKSILTENMFLHIPLGSKHSVSVAEGNLLHYIWLDFFITLEGQKYMEEEHKVLDK